nr:class I SAM-dependent methyltransferase [Abyssibacter sp.]
MALSFLIILLCLGLGTLIHARSRSIKREIRRATATTTAEVRQLYSWVSLVNVLQPRLVLPEPGRWAASADLLATLHSLVVRERPHRVVELGGGLTTLVTAYALERCGLNSEIVSIDHDLHFQALTKQQAGEHQQASRVRFVHAPLEAVGGWCWYTMNPLADIADIDLLVVDGPPWGLDGSTRAPAEQLFERLSNGAWILVDDANRDAEQSMIDAWCRRYPLLQHVPLPDHQKGACLLRWRAS